MSKIQIISVDNGNPDFIEIRAQYLNGKQSFSLHTIPASQSREIETAVQSFQAVADTMKVSQKPGGHINVKSPDGTWHTAENYIAAAGDIADIIKKESRPAGGCPMKSKP